MVATLVAMRKGAEGLEVRTAEEATTQAPLAHRYNKRPPQPQVLRRLPRLQKKQQREPLAPRQLPATLPLPPLWRQRSPLLGQVLLPRQAPRLQNHRAQYQLRSSRVPDPRFSAQQPQRTIQTRILVLSLLCQ